MTNKLRLGAESFWEMAALAMAGRLASCQSCVEHFYFQSYQNAVAFLDSCAKGGLVEKVSLLDMRGDLGTQPTPTLKRWYDQAIYISAPLFRNQNLDAARERVENTKNAVYNAFHLYYEVLGADNDAIDVAYLRAVKEGKLRYSDVARSRCDVDLSPVAKLRLILDGNRKATRIKNPELSGRDVEKLAIDATVEYVQSPSAEDIALIAAPRPPVSDHAEELEEFIIGFLDDYHALAKFWQEEDGDIPQEYHLQLLPVVSELVFHRYKTLKQSGDVARAAGLAATIREKIDAAQQREADDDDYVVALSELREDLDVLTSEEHSTILAQISSSSQLGAEALAK